MHKFVFSQTVAACLDALYIRVSQLINYENMDGKLESNFCNALHFRRSWERCLIVAFATPGIVSILGKSATAQIIPDTALGAESSVVITNVDINGQLDDRIHGGALRGANLFHSFKQFNIEPGSGAYFSNPTGVKNIFTRVIGGVPSNIQGRLGVLGNANLFLINPSGIIFGPNARLDLAGSFIATTASSLNFDDNTQFRATDQAPPLLTVSVPVGLQYEANSGGILVQGNGKGTRLSSALIDTAFGLQVQSNQTLALLGGNIRIEGGTLKTPGGRIEIGSVTGAGRVNLSPTERGFALSYPDTTALGEIQLTQQATVDASGIGGGDVRVRGERLLLSDGSQIEASTLGNAAGGMLQIEASDMVELVGTVLVGKYFIPSGLSAFVYPNATGAGGSLTINTQKLVLGEGGTISTATLGRGAGGTLDINARDSIEVSGALVAGQPAGGIATSVAPSGTGPAGNLNLETRKLVLRDGGRISTTALGQGMPGNLFIEAESVELRGTLNGTPTILSAQARETANGGNLEVKTENLSVLDGARVSTSSLGTGNAGGIKIRSRSMRLQNNASVVAITRSGNGGNIDLQVDDSLALRRNSLISTDTATVQAGGNGGNISINAGVIAALENSDITANAQGGTGGRVSINAQGIFRSPDSDITAIGKSPELSGTVEINTPDVDPSRGLVKLPEEPVDATGLIAQGCLAGAGSTASKFVITGTGGIPPSPSDPLNSYAVWLPPSQVADDSMSPSTEQANGEPTQIVEAQGWRQNPDGTITLTAEASGVVPYNTLNATPSCHSQPSLSRVPPSTNAARTE